jgi:hypothetical protein
VREGEGGEGGGGREGGREGGRGRGVREGEGGEGEGEGGRAGVAPTVELSIRHVPADVLTRVRQREHLPLVLSPLSRKCFYLECSGELAQTTLRGRGWGWGCSGHERARPA